MAHLNNGKKKTHLASHCALSVDSSLWWNFNGHWGSLSRIQTSSTCSWVEFCLSRSGQVAHFGTKMCFWFTSLDWVRLLRDCLTSIPSVTVYAQISLKINQQKTDGNKNLSVSWKGHHLPLKHIQDSGLSSFKTPFSLMQSITTTMLLPGLHNTVYGFLPMNPGQNI